jgi:hypothetical protein
MKLTSLSLTVMLIGIIPFSPAGNPATVKDYLNVPGPLQFDHSDYFLSWSAHPAENYFKQEYLPAGQVSASYSKMMMIEAATGAVSLQTAVKTKRNELEQRKKTDPLCNYQLVQNPATGEYLLDFMMSQSAGGKTTIAEWDAYRYTVLPGNKGILLFACSRRSYGSAIPGFLRLLKTKRLTDINALSTCSIPLVQIKLD